MSRAEEISVRLREMAERFRREDLSDEEAQELADEASTLIAEAGSEVDRRLADAAAAKPPENG